MPRFTFADSEDKAGDWKYVGSAGSADDTDGDMRGEAETEVSSVLGAEHVGVLAGLGTSRAVLASSGGVLFPTMGDLWSKVEAAAGSDLFEAVQQAVHLAGQRNIEELLSRCVMKRELETDQDESDGEEARVDVEGFLDLAERAIRKACGPDLSGASMSTHEGFLRRLIARGARRPRVSVFTTNYDLCFEAASARIGLPVIDGFTFTEPPRFNPEVFDHDIVTGSPYSETPEFIPNLIRLFKLHGSIDWHFANAGFVSKRVDADRPLLIYPQSGKYASSYSPPFLEAMSRFQALLRQRNVGLVVIGYGFSDKHVSEPILAAVKSNPSLRMVVCAPDLREKLQANGDGVGHETLEQFNLLVAEGDRRLVLIDGDFANLVDLMPSLGAPTATDQHEQRIRKLELEVARLRARRGSGQ